MGARLSVGIGGVLEDPDDPEPGGYTRDGLSFDIVNTVADALFLDDYEVRDIIKPTWVCDYPFENEHLEAGELVFLTRSDDSAGPLPLNESQALLDKIDAVGRVLEIEPVLATVLAPRQPALILPPPTFESRLMFTEGHPLHGMAYGNVVEVIKRVEELPFERIKALLEICREDRLILSVVTD